MEEMTPIAPAYSAFIHKNKPDVITNTGLCFFYNNDCHKSNIMQIYGVLTKNKTRHEENDIG